MPEAEYLEPFCRSVGEVVRRDVLERVGLKAEGAANAAGAAVASGEDIDVGVADHDGFGGGDDAPGDRAGFSDEGLKALRVGLFRVEAVTAVVLEEEARKIEMGADVAGGVDGFVGQDCHEDLGMSGSDCGD